MIKAVLNGYYRSGTTLMYKIMKYSNKDLKVFYEPFHPNLKNEIFENRNAILLHGINVFEEYLELKNLENYFEIFQGKISKEYMDNILDEGNIDILEKVLIYFENQKFDVCLQTNRLHFLLDYLLKNKKIPTLHIIRNPLDVFYSTIYDNARRKTNRIYNLLYKVRNNSIGKFITFNIIQRLNYTKDLFFVEDNFKWIKNKFHLEYNENGLSFFEKQLIVWAYFNFYATKKLGKKNIFYFEEFLKDPIKVSKWIENKLKIKFDPNILSLRKTTTTNNENLVMLNEYFEKLQIRKKVKYFYPKLIL